MLSTFIGDSRLDGGADLILGPHVPEMESRQASAELRSLCANSRYRTVIRYVAFINDALD